MATFNDMFKKEMSKKDQSVFDSATIAYTNTIRKSLGLKEYASKGGLFGRLVKSKPSESTGSPGVSSMVSGSIRILAKNSMSLPVMARDMNIMRQNIQLMVKKQGLTPKNKTDSSFSPTSKSSTTTVPSSSKSSKGSFMESAGGIVKSAGGGILSMGTGIASGLFGVLGAAGTGFLSMFSGMFGMSPIMMAVAGYIISVLYRAIPFKKIGSEFTKIFSDAVNGLSKFFGIDLKNVFGDAVSNLKKYFGVGKDEGFLDSFAKRLDETFKTSFFTDNLRRASTTLVNATEDTAIFLKNTYATIMKYVMATALTTSDMLSALGTDVKNYMRIWLDDNRVELYMIMGGVMGAAMGAIVPVLGSALGGILGVGFGKQYGEQYNKDKERIIQAYGGAEQGLERTTKASGLIGRLLQTNEGRKDDVLVNFEKNKDFFKELSAATGLSMGHYESLSGQGDLTLGYFRKRLKEINEAKNVLELEVLRKNGTNSLAGFDVQAAMSRRLDETGQMFPQTAYPTRVYPVDDVKKPAGNAAYGAPRKNKNGTHAGVDYLGKLGDPIYAMQDGVAHVKHEKSMGDYITVTSATGSTVYGHIRKALIKEGDTVKFGQQIAEMGDTGNAKGTPQLHFEAYSGSKPFDSASRLNPEDFLAGINKSRPSMESNGESAAASASSVVSSVVASTKENIVTPLMSKMDELIAAFLSKDTNVNVNVASNDTPAETYNDEWLKTFQNSAIRGGF